MAEQSRCGIVVLGVDDMTDYITFEDSSKMPLDDWYSKTSSAQRTILKKCARRKLAWEKFVALTKKYPNTTTAEAFAKIKILRRKDIWDHFKKVHTDYDWARFEQANKQAIRDGYTKHIDKVKQGNVKRNTKYFYQGKSLQEWANELGCNHECVRRNLHKYGHLDFVHNNAYWNKKRGEQ